MMTEVFNYVPWTMVEVENIINPEGYLLETKRLLDELRVNYYFAFGTALGLYRDNGFVKGDTDVDVAVMTSDPWRVVEEFRNNYKLIRKVEVQGVLQQAVFRGDDGFFIDICFFYLLNGALTSYCEGGRWEDDPLIIGTPKEIETKYGKFLVPQHIEKYLQTRYGDWQTPRYGAISQSIKA
jgi:phosphorylcholine metabolism protein LicD